MVACVVFKVGVRQEVSQARQPQPLANAEKHTAGKNSEHPVKLVEALPLEQKIRRDLITTSVGLSPY